jgi:hypothetical protein
LTAFLTGLACVLLGVWWAPFLAGIAIGLITRRTPAAIVAGGLGGLVSWILPLGAMHVRYGLGPTAMSLAAIMGFGNRGLIPVVLTLVVGTLLGLTGAWLGIAARTVLRPEPR